MKEAIDEAASPVGWEIARILKARSRINVEQLVNLYKSWVLSYVEYRTPCLYHAAAFDLENLDKLQRTFLAELGISELEAMQHCKLAPLGARRDMAMLGVLHRVALGKGPSSIAGFFPRASGVTHDYHLRSQQHSRALHCDMADLRLEVWRNSLLGLTAVCNRLYL